jgi:hypothetical protein
MKKKKKIKGLKILDERSVAPSLLLQVLVAQR